MEGNDRHSEGRHPGFQPRTGSSASDSASPDQSRCGTGDVCGWLSSRCAVPSLHIRALARLCDSHISSLAKLPCIFHSAQRHALVECDDARTRTGRGPLARSILVFEKVDEMAERGDNVFAGRLQVWTEH